MSGQTEAGKERFVLSFPRAVYRLSAVKKAAYKFTEAFFVTIETESSDVTVVTLVPGERANCSWDALSGQFRNEVLDQELRETIAEETNGIRDLILAQAFSEVSVFHPEFDKPSGESEQQVRGSCQGDESSPAANGEI